MNKMKKNCKVVYDLKTIEKLFKGVENMPILQNKSFSYSVRERFYKNDSILEEFNNKQENCKE